MKFIRKWFENQEIANLRAEVAEVKAFVQVTRIELFEYLEKVMSPLAKRLAVRISREKKEEQEHLSSEEHVKKGGLMSPSQFNKLKQDGTI